MSKIEVNQISSQCGSTLTIGQSGDTVTLACGATQSGFGRTGTVDWNTTAITADPNPAVSGTGYFVNTTSGAITITLPTSPAAGDIVAFADYALTWDTNNLTLDPGSNKINGDTTDYTVSTEGRSLTLVYTDSTQGWKVVNDGNSTAGSQAKFVTATGGTVSCCGDYKIHTFTGPGTFTVTCAGNPTGSTTVDYLVVAGGGGGGTRRGSSAGGASGAGAGGYRESSGAASGCYSASPLGACVAALPVSVTSYPITVGAGGTSPPAGVSTPNTNANGTSGSNSIFSTITAAGGGGGRAGPCGGQDGAPGGSGGGGSGGSCAPHPGGTGNTPPVSPPQGNNGGAHTGPSTCYSSAAGGGAGGVGGNNPGPRAGGSSVSTSISGSSTPYASGGNGGIYAPPTTNGIPQPANSGNGGPGATGNACGTVGGTGGSGIVIIRYKYQ